jgi:hypothetical protein
METVPEYYGALPMEMNIVSALPSAPAFKVQGLRRKGGRRKSNGERLTAERMP